MTEKLQDIMTDLSLLVADKPLLAQWVKKIAQDGAANAQEAPTLHPSRTRDTLLAYLELEKEHFFQNTRSSAQTNTGAVNTIDKSVHYT